MESLRDLRVSLFFVAQLNVGKIGKYASPMDPMGKRGF